MNLFEVLALFFHIVKIYFRGISFKGKNRTNTVKEL
jgi:hypothetical protein